MNIQINISEQALDRLQKDRYIKNNKKLYMQELRMISASQGNRSSETIGKFLVSPKGNKKIRVAWHFEYDSKTDTKIIYIDDFLYHITEEYYVDKWNEKARIGKINLSSYSGYTPWAGF